MAIEQLATRDPYCSPVPPRPLIFPLDHCLHPYVYNCVGKHEDSPLLQRVDLVAQL